MKVKVINKSHHPLPQYQSLQAAGLDLRANLENPITLQPLEHCLVPTGLFIELPAGYEAQVRPRSGLAFKHGITVLNSPGTIDADYRGEVGVLLVNLSNKPFVIEDGERVAQMVVARYEQVEWQDSETLSDTERGAGGFGHSGLKCLLALILATCLAACGSVKSFMGNANEQQPATTITTDTAAVHQVSIVRKLPQSALKIFNAQGQTMPDFTASRVQLSMGKLSVNVNVRYARETGLLASVNMLGFEGARLEMDSTGIRGIDKVHKQYFALTYDELQKKYGTPLTLSNMADLLMGRVFLLGQNDLDAQHDAFATLKSGTTKSGGAVYWTVGQVEQRFDTDAQNQLQKTRLKRNTEEIFFLYSDWQKGNQPYPLNIQVISQGETKASIGLSYQKLEFTTPSIQWQDLSRYTPITLEQLMNTYLK